jgi:hypothetical protein
VYNFKYSIFSTVKFIFFYISINFKILFNCNTSIISTIFRESNFRIISGNAIILLLYLL